MTFQNAGVATYGPWAGKAQKQKKKTILVVMVLMLKLDGFGKKQNYSNSKQETAQSDEMNFLSSSLKITKDMTDNMTPGLTHIITSKDSCRSSK